MRHELSANVVISATLVIGFANAIAKPVTRLISDLGFQNALWAGFGLNAIVCGAFALATGLIYFAPSRPVSQNMLFASYGTLAVFMVPVASISWLTLGLFGIFVALRHNDETGFRTGGAIIAAAALRQPVSKAILDLFAGPLLDLDAAAASLWISIGRSGIMQDGNMLSTGGSHDLLVLSGCSSFTNLSFALLIWFCLSMAVLKQLTAKAWVAAALIAVFVPVTNQIRLALMGVDQTTYSFIHDGEGVLIFEISMMAGTLALTYWGLRHVRQQTANV